jgi:hypothetical protein
MKKLSPFVRIGSFVGTGLDIIMADAVRLGGAVDELEDEGTTRDNTSTSGEAIAKRLASISCPEKKEPR